MYLYKFKTTSSEFNKETQIESRFDKGYMVEIRSVFYSSNNPQSTLIILDADGDPFMFQLHGTSSPTTRSPDVPVVAKLPLSYVDTTGENIIIIWGVVHKEGA